jgi:hypothetical protein
MPVDRAEIRRLAADAEVVATIKTVDGYFNVIAARYRSGISSRKSHYWQQMKQGIFCLKDDGDDDDAPIVRKAVTPDERARARVMRAKLFAVRQHIRCVGRRQRSTNTGQSWVVPPG